MPGQWLLAKLRVVPKEPALIVKLASRVIPKVAGRHRGVELLNWFLDEEAGDLYIILRGGGEAASIFLEDLASDFRREGVLAYAAPTGARGFDVAPVVFSNKNVHFKVMVNRAEEGRPRLVVDVDGFMYPLDEHEVLRLLILAGLNLSEAEEALSEVFSSLRGRTVISPSELARSIITYLSQRGSPSASLLSAVRAALCPYFYIALEGKGRLIPISRSIVRREVENLVKLTGLEAPRNFVERVTDRVYVKLVLEAISASSKYSFSNYPVRVLSLKEFRDMITRETVRESPVLAELLRGISPEKVVNRELGEASKILKEAGRTALIPVRLSLVLSALSKLLICMALTKGYVPLADISENAHVLGEEDLVSAVRRVYMSSELGALKKALEELSEAALRILVNLEKLCKTSVSRP